MNILKISLLHGILFMATTYAMNKEEITPQATMPDTQTMKNQNKLPAKSVDKPTISNPFERSLRAIDLILTHADEPTSKLLTDRYTSTSTHRDSYGWYDEKDGKFTVLRGCTASKTLDTKTKK